MKNVLMSYGCGGHRKQADRIYKTLSNDDYINFFSVTDVGNKPDWSVRHLELTEFRDKYDGKVISFFLIFSQILKVFFFLKNNNIKNVISTGPGVCIVSCIAAKLSGCVIIHIETWSKFESLTLTTKVVKFLTCNVLYQNKELKKFLPSGKYVGRL
jgi:beta-1,4-N-acetylglucosaminyltransferase